MRVYLREDRSTFELIVCLKVRTNKRILLAYRKITHPTIEVRGGHDVVTCARDGADGHELGRLATGSCHCRGTTFECRNALFEDVLRVCNSNCRNYDRSA